MKKFITLAAVAFCTAFVASLSSAQVTSGNDKRIVIASDSSSGTYNKMLGEIIGVCSNEDFDIQPAKGISGGARGNLQALVDNKVQAAFLHSDVFFASSMADPSYKKFQTLVALYPEPIHVLALKVSKTSVQGLKSYLGNKQEFKTLADTKGFTVGAAGGGVLTARILTGQGQGGFLVQEYPSGGDVINALNAGEIAAAIFVGAAPLPNLENLKNKEAFKLIPIGESIAANVRTVYRPASINYPGMTSGPIPTLAPMATLLTRKFSTEARVAAQRHFRECFNSNLGELKDNASANWQSVEPNDHGVLDWYEIPPAPASTPAKAANRK